VIEPLLEAERAFVAGLLDRAQELFRAVAEQDPGNSIAVVGLARVAFERGEELEALALARRVLAIDPDNAAASRLADRIVEIRTYRGEPTPTTDATAQAAMPTPRAGRTRWVPDRLRRRS
jgi:hypothetical protein